MASNRYISTKYWSDSYVEKLEPLESFLFLYLLTNAHTNIAGIYDITMRTIEFDTRLESKFIAKTLKKFQDEGKIYYENDWVVIANWVKNQQMNPSVKTGIERVLNDLPTWLQEKVGVMDKIEKPNDLPLFENKLSISSHKLGTESYILNLTKLNLTKPNADEPRESSKELSKPQKRQYALAMNREREQKAKADDARSRPGSSPSKAKPPERKWR